MASTKRPGGLTPAVVARRQARQAARERQERTLRDVLARHAPRLAAGEKDAGLDSKTLGDVLADAQKDGALDSIRKVRRMLRNVLVEMQKVTGGNVELPAPEVSMRRPPSPFNPENFQHLPWLSEVMTAFINDLEATRQVSDELSAGRILFSAIVFGGLLHRALVARFPSSLKLGPAQHDGLCWLEINLENMDEDSSGRVRRWFPDPITQCLIANWCSEAKSWPQGKSGSPAALLRKLLNHLDVPHGLARRNPMAGLLSVAQTRFRLFLPGILVDFLASADHGQSVPSHVWWRLVADHHVTTPEVLVSDEDAADEFCAGAEPPDFDPTEHIENSSRDLGSVAVLKKSLKRAGRFLKPTAALRSVIGLRQTLGPRGPMFTALLDWTAWLLQMLSSGKRRVKPQSAYRYLSSFAYALIAAAGEVDPVSATELQLQAKYQEVLASIRSTKERSRAAKCLRDFHSFLVLTRDVPVVEIDGIVSGKQRVRANIISDVEYHRALVMINESELDERSRAMLRVMLIVLYRLGPRRNELAYLRLKDVHDGSGDGAISARPLLWIHSHPDAGLKTDDSIRRLPLAHLLTTDELGELIDWKRRRVLESSPNPPDQALLFCIQGRNTERLRDADIDVLVAVLRQICQDDTIILHTLRHAFQSHLFARLSLADLARRDKNGASCPWLTEIRKGGGLLKRLFNADANGLPRETAYLLSTFAGHLDPTETMHTYIHCQDWVSGLYVRELSAEFNISLWASLEGIRADALMVRHSREKKRTGRSVQPHRDTPLRLLRALKLELPSGTPGKDVLQVIPSVPDERSKIERLPLEGIFCLIALLNRSMTQQAREHVTGIDRKVFERLKDVALEIAKTRTSTRNRAARRPRFLADDKKKRRRPQLARLPQLDGFGPAIPRERAERSDAREAYRQSVRIDSNIDEDALNHILNRTSHTDPVLVSSTIEDVVRTTTILSRLGISRGRMQLEVRSLPKHAVDAKKWQRQIAEDTGFAVNSIKLASSSVATTRSARTHPAGRIAVQILQPGRKSKASSGDQDGEIPTAPRLGYGWRVGCFYALCVKRCVTKPVSPSTPTQSTP